MAKEQIPPDLMGYETLVQTALRGVVRQALERAASSRGLPGDHHLYISFRTGAAGVAIPPELRARYPEAMTIVLQNQFRELSVGEEAFSVTLQFGGQPKRLSIPFEAVLRFNDPAVRFVLDFPIAPVQEVPPPRPAVDEDTGPRVVSLDQFRKK
jgi:hypothetical protein